MKKILAFAGSNSKKSINYKLLEHIVSRIHGHQIKLTSFAGYDIPIYNIDIEKEKGIPLDIRVIKTLLDENDAFIIAVNEHNGTISAYFKNIIDWLSRLERNFFQGKKILLVSTATGARGGAGALEYLKSVFPRFGGQVVESFSFPSFKDNYADNKILDEVLELGVEDVLTTFAHQIEE